LDTKIVDLDERVSELDERVSEADFSFKTYLLSSGISIKCYGPTVQDLAPSNTADANSRNAQPPKDGFRPQDTYGNPLPIIRDANFSLRFLNFDQKSWLTDLDVFVYQGDRKILTLDTKNNGYVGIWEQFGEAGDAADKWRKSNVEIRTRQKLLITAGPHLPPLDWGERRAGHDKSFDAWFVMAKVVDDFPDIPPQSRPTAETARSEGLTRIGRFDFEICRGDLTPLSTSRGEAIPELDANSSLRGMMYVENEGENSFPSGTLNSTPAGRYRVLMPHQNLNPDSQRPFFFQDERRVYFVTMPERPQPTGTARGPLENAIERMFRRRRFDVFYHPHVCDFITSVNRKGIDELLTLQSQSLDDKGTDFNGYQPDASKVQLSQVDRYNNVVPTTRECVDFETSGSYSIYNWELFFHAPLLIATKLTTNQRFEEARAWLHFIFDPTTRPGAFNPSQPPKPTQRFWNVRPFWEAEGRVDQSIDDLLKGREDLRVREQYAEWRANPFKPFAVARLRHIAFMQSVVMRYLDNLIAWGDQQFARFTMESTNEATLLYILAADILGKGPEKIPPRARPTLQTYLSMQQQARTSLPGGSSNAWQNFSELMVEIEAYIPPAAVPGGSGDNSALGRMWAFCLPSNEKLLTYWPLVADRLFNLRHCRDIEGVERQIPLWDPPIDPGLLVRAAAAGVDLASVLDDVNAALPNYRFTVMLQKAAELCNEVKNFGAALLSAIEKKDGEGLALLRSQHEISILQAMKDVRDNQVKESTALREAAQKSMVTVEERRNHYRDIAQYIPGELTGLTLSFLALTQEAVAAGSDAIAAIAAIVPQYSAGTSGFYSSPVVVAAYGGEQLSRAASASASLARSTAGIMAGMSAMSHTVAGFQRRWDDWKLQETLANKELDQIQKQIDAATIREAITQAELKSHNEQIENAKAVDEYLKGKFTNQELYGWMQSQLASLYFQAYKLAYAVAKKAERAFRHELGLKSSNYVQFGYWDSLKKGLLAGEKLGQDLKRMEVAYLDQNKREYEITKHVSLLQLDPLALVLLRESGRCEFSVPEALFDLDYPGHYMRRIKSVSVTIPCVVGPYATVPCTATLLKSQIRHNNLIADGYARDLQNDDPRFTDLFSSIQSIVTSGGQSDSGLFETNLRDERFLPFEGAGAISTWHLELPTDFRPFEYDTISDVVLHIRYTAREGGALLSQQSAQELQDAINALIGSGGKPGLARIISLRHEFPTEWYRFKTVADANGKHVQTFSLSKDRFPFLFQGRTISITQIDLLGVPKPVTDQPPLSNLKFNQPQTAIETTPDSGAQIGKLIHLVKSGLGVVVQSVTEPAMQHQADWILSVEQDGNGNMQLDQFDDILIVCSYQVTRD